MKAPSQRQLRVGELVRKALSQVFTRGDVYNAYLAQETLTITEVRMSPDLKHAFVFIAPLGKPYSQALEEALAAEMPRLRQIVAKTVQLRAAPQLHFEADLSFEEADRINSLLKSPKVAQDLG